MKRRLQWRYTCCDLCHAEHRWLWLCQVHYHWLMARWVLNKIIPSPAIYSGVGPTALELQIGAWVLRWCYRYGGHWRHWWQRDRWSIKRYEAQL